MVNVACLVCPTWTDGHCTMQKTHVQKHDETPSIKTMLRSIKIHLSPFQIHPLLASPINMVQLQITISGLTLMKHITLQELLILTKHLKVYL